MNTINSSILQALDFGWPILPEKSAQHLSQYDYRLARRVAAGDLEAFEELYQRHYRRVHNLCLRMTNNIAEAEDLTQEVFIHLYRKIGSFRGDSAFTTWLHRLTVNKVLMYFRSSKRRRDQTTVDGLLPETGPKEGGRTDRPLMLDRLTLERAILQLPPGYRAVFVLHDVEGYDHAETARILGNSIGTTKSQLHKARKRLRSLLRETSPSHVDCLMR
jgi:RNA polymerase sigma-70 factor, ECF subfamily